MNRKATLAEFVERVWNNGEAAAVERYLADTYTIEHDPGDPWEGRVLSRDDFRERVVQSRSAAPKQRFTLVDLLADGDSVAVSWTWQGTHLGDLPGFPASGRRLTMSGLTIYRFAGDRICGHWQVADRLSVLRQLRGG